MVASMDHERSIGKTSEKAVKVVISDDILGAVSGLGRFQILQALLILFPIITTSMSNLNFVFAAAAVNYRCTLPRCETENATITSPEWWPSNTTDGHCSQPVYTSDTSCDPNDFVKMEPCEKWIYDNDNSIDSKFDLACQDWKRALIGTIHNIGVFFSMPLIGYVADKFGRRNAIILSGLSLCVGACKTLVGAGEAGYAVYVVIEFVEALLVTGSYTSCFVLLIELIGSQKRIIGSAAIGIALNIGEISLSLIVWWFPYWKHFLLIIYGTGPLFLIYFLLLQESMRWLLTSGKKVEAMTLLEKILKWNHIAVSRDINDSDLSIPTKNKEEECKETFSFRLLFSSPVILKRVIVCSCWWFTVGFVYYSLSLGSVLLPGNKILNFALSASCSLIGQLLTIQALNQLGRRKTMMSGFLITGICCFVSAMTQQAYAVVGTAAQLLAKLSITICFSGGYVYTSELTPTSLRASLLGICSMFARIGSVLAPLTPLMYDVWRPLPTLLFGASSMFAAALVLGAPETLNKPLPDTVAQAAQIK